MSSFVPLLSQLGRQWPLLSALSPSKYLSCDVPRLLLGDRFAVFIPPRPLLYSSVDVCPPFLRPSFSSVRAAYILHGLWETYYMYDAAVDEFSCLVLGLFPPPPTGIVMASGRLGTLDINRD